MYFVFTGKHTIVVQGVVQLSTISTIIFICFIENNYYKYLQSSVKITTV